MVDDTCLWHNFTRDEVTGIYFNIFVQNQKVFYNFGMYLHKDL